MKLLILARIANEEEGKNIIKLLQDTGAKIECAEIDKALRGKSKLTVTKRVFP